MKKINNLKVLTITEIKEYELDYMELRPLLATVVNFDNLFRFEKSSELRMNLIKGLKGFKLYFYKGEHEISFSRIIKMVTCSESYRKVKYDEKLVYIYFELCKYIPFYFIHEYFDLEKDNLNIPILQLRDKLCEYVPMKYIIILEKYHEFQRLCLMIGEDKYNRLIHLVNLVVRFGDDSKNLFIPEIFNVEDALLTKELIYGLSDILDEETIKKLKLKTYYRDKQKLSKEVVNFVFDTLNYNVNESKQLIDNFSEKIEKMKYYKIGKINHIIAFSSFYRFMNNVDDGHRIGKVLQHATNKEIGYLNLINNDKTGWFARSVNNSINLLNEKQS